jgi:hypothetical protein
MHKPKEKSFFQIQSVDNFFDDPEEIVKFANSLEYKIGPYGFWPGKRSDELHINHRQFYNSFMIRLLALFFDFENTKLSWSDVGMYFQKTTAFDNTDKNNILNTGLIHQDGDYPLVGLVYLTKDADPDSGTSIMKPTKNYESRLEKELGQKQTDLYKKPQKELTKKNLDDYKKLIIDKNKNFLESLRFNNIYNRLVTYSGKDYHKCNSFYSGKNERLTLVFFVKKIQVNRHPPLQRSKVHLIKFK